MREKCKDNNNNKNKGQQINRPYFLVAESYWKYRIYESQKSTQLKQPKCSKSKSLFFGDVLINLGFIMSSWYNKKTSPTTERSMFEFHEFSNLNKIPVYGGEKTLIVYCSQPQILSFAQRNYFFQRNQLLLAFKSKQELHTIEWKFIGAICLVPSFLFWFNNTISITQINTCDYVCGLVVFNWMTLSL